MSSPELPDVTDRKPATFVWLFPVALVIALGLFGGGVYLAAVKGDYALLAAGGVSIVVTLLAWPVAMMGSTATMDHSFQTRLAPVISKVDQLLATLTLISEQQLISDRAKQIAYREKDREAFRRAIHEDVAKRDYDAAITLLDEMKAEFGSREETDQLRKEIAAQRDDTVKRAIEDAIAVVEQQIDNEQWQIAFREADRLKVLFPEQARIQLLPTEIEQARQSVKRTLLARWQEHVKAKNVDDAIFVLRKLDLYVTPQEAVTLEEDARMIFKEKLAKLRVDFTAAVQGHHWKDAKKLAETVMNDFPNTQMAREVREMMPTLEERLRDLQAAGGGLHTMAAT